MGKLQHNGVKQRVLWNLSVQDLSAVQTFLDTVILLKLVTQVLTSHTCKEGQ